MWKSLPVLLAACLISLVTAAQPAGGLGQYLKEGHPDSYTVVRGDTLWDISGMFLDRPWLWPELWRVNPQIENPHLIYPGDRLRLVYIDGEPALMLDRGDAGRTYKVSPSSDGKLEPRIRETPLETAIPTISLDAIQGFLVENRVVPLHVLLDAPYVVQGESERLVLGGGDRVYVRGDLSGSAAYNIMRKGPVYVDPETEEMLGQEATYVGIGRVSAQEGEISTLFISESRQEVQIGDRILPTEERRVNSTFFPSAPDTDVNGLIISVFGGVTQVGQYDVVVINRGEREGIEVGHVLAIYRGGGMARDRIAKDMVRLPSERAGLMMVFRTFEKLSYGLVLAAERPLAVEDEVRNP